MLRLPSLLLAAAVAAACAPLLPHVSGAAGAPRDLAAERRSLLAADSALAAAVGERGMLHGLLPALADDAHYLQPQQPLVRGRAAVRALFERRSSSGALRFAWRAVRTDVSADGTLGYTYGYGRYLPAGADSTPASGDGGYVAVWRKAPDGAWRVVVFLRNNARAALAAAPPGFASPTDRSRSFVEGADATAAAAAMSRADRDFSDLAARVGVGEAFAAYAAPDGALLGGAFGPDAIRASFAGGPSSIGSWRPVHADAAASGELGYTVGVSENRTVRDGRPVATYTKYVSIWRRQPDGAWRYVMDAGSGSPPP